MTDHAAPPTKAPSPLPAAFAILSAVLVPVNAVIWWLAFSRESSTLYGVFALVGLVQLVAGLTALVAGLVQHLRGRKRGLVPAIVGGLTAVGALAGLTGALVWSILIDIADSSLHGRPLRVRGRPVRARLRAGSAWTAGARPDVAGTSAATRRALEALWLRDAQTEHASVPAFARISWMLAAAGAPPELLAWSARASIEEIEHARACFALAAGYGGRTHGPEAMPELRAAGIDVRGDVRDVLAAESIADGVMLEGFNADVAEAAATRCEEPVARAVLERIAREERSHADFSWAVVQWLLDEHPAAAVPAIERALARLAALPRPRAVSTALASIVAQADATELLRHGRIDDARWAALWNARLTATRALVQVALDSRGASRLAA